MKTFFVTLFIAIGLSCMFNGMAVESQPEKAGISDIAVPGFP